MQLVVASEISPRRLHPAGCGLCAKHSACASQAVRVSITHYSDGGGAQAVGFAVLAIGTVVYARGDEGEDHKSAVAADVVRTSFAAYSLLVVA